VDKRIKKMVQVILIRLFFNVFIFCFSFGKLLSTRYFMNDKIIIKNLGPLKQVELDLKEIMVFIGPQASGKSTIAKLIHFFKYVTSVSCLNSQPEDLLSIFNKFFGEHYLRQSPNADIKYLSHCKITLKNGTIRYNHLPQSKYKTLLIPAGRAVYSLISESLFSLTSEAISIDPMILNFGRHIELSRKKLGNILSQEKELEALLKDILKGNFKYVNGENRIYFEENQYITLDRASSGQQEVLPLMLILMEVFYSGQLNFVTIEEPEAHLYPYSQYKLIELINRVHHSHFDKNRFIITTHSPYILTAFNNFLFSYQVANLNESAKVKVKAVMPEASWINPKQLAAYYVSEGSAESILNDSTGLIDDNEIDDVSEEIAGHFDTLLDIYRTFKHGNG
jgi:AAA15 family ATPase/GTPase